MKTGLIMEGGAMRGMYTAGVTDVLMENNITFDGAVGVSAGAVFGCNYKSHQIGRVIRYNKKYCRDSRYVSIRSLIRTGDIYGESFCYHELPEKLDIFDTETYKNSPMEFYVVCTDAVTGRAVYHKCDNGDAGDIQWMRASAAMPVLSKPVHIDGQILSDGGTSDSIPVRFFQKKGYDKNLVILTQPAGYVKKRNSYIPVIRAVLKKYPELVKALENRHEMYNETLEYIRKEEETGKLFVIRPSRKLEVGAVERNQQRLEAVYQCGRKDASERLEEIKAWLY